MKLRDLVFRLVLLAALAGAIVWLALHREIFSPPGRPDAASSPA